MSKLLPPKVRKPLLQGLRSAFADIGKFDYFLRTNLSKERADIVADTSNVGYLEQIELVVRDAEYGEYIEELIEEACREQATNEDLSNAASCYKEYKAKSAIARAPVAFSSWIRSKIGFEIPGVFFLSLLLLCVGIAFIGSKLHQFSPIEANIVAMPDDRDVFFVGETAKFELVVNSKPLDENSRLDWRLEPSSIGTVETLPSSPVPTAKVTFAENGDAILVADINDRQHAFKRKLTIRHALRPAE